MLILRKATLLLLTVILLGISACRTGGGDEFATPLPNQTDRHQEGEHEHVGEDEFTTDMRAVLVPSELVVGPNRFAVGLLDPDGAIIDDATVHFHYYDLSDRENPIIESEVDARSVTSADARTTIYAHDREFERVGLYGLEIEARRSDGTVLKQRIGFEVAAESAALGPGDRAPGLNTATAEDVGGNLSLLTSAPEPVPALHERSLAQALGNEEPTLLLLATPAFCQTRFCGPAYETFADLQEAYGEQVNFVYAEVFDGLPDPGNSGFRPSAAAQAFRIESEPWAYFIDNQGLIVYRLEGLFTAAELEAQMQKWFDL